MRDDSVEALDDILLAVLDDKLLFESMQTVDTFATTEDAMDEFDLLLPLEVPPLADERATSDTKPAKLFTLNRSGSGKSVTRTSSLKSKDESSAPYSKMNKPCRRKRPKDELDYLRAKVVDMEEELQSLQTKTKIGSPAAVGAAVVVNGESDCLHDVLNWKRIAEQQKKEVARLMVENVRLRATLNGQLNVTRAAIDQAFFCSVAKMEMAAFH